MGILAAAGGRRLGGRAVQVLDPVVYREDEAHSIIRYFRTKL